VSRTGWILLLSLAICASAAVMALFAIDRHRSRPEHLVVVPVGDEVRYDDFAFAVVGSREEPVLVGANGTVQPQGRFVVVTLRVANYAKRVEFTFRPDIIRLVAADGREFAVERAVPANGCESELAPGTSCTAELAFDVPRDSGPLRARVRSNLGLFDMIDRVLYGKKQLSLDGAADRP
jgi:hypothetical protein